MSGWCWLASAISAIVVTSSALVRYVEPRKVTWIELDELESRWLELAEHQNG